MHFYCIMHRIQTQLSFLWSSIISRQMVLFCFYNYYHFIGLSILSEVVIVFLIFFPFKVKSLWAYSLKCSLSSLTPQKWELHSDPAEIVSPTSVGNRTCSAVAAVTVTCKSFHVLDESLRCLHRLKAEESSTLSRSLPLRACMKK